MSIVVLSWIGTVGVLPQAGEEEGKEVARIATARKMLRAIYWMLLNQDEFTIPG